MRAIKIDPYNETITEIDIAVEDNGLRGVYAHIPNARSVSFVYSIPKHFLMVDDEGLLNENVHKLFIHRSYPQPLAGVGIVMGKVGVEGDLGPATIKLKDIMRDTAFVSHILEYDGMETNEGHEEHPVFGKVFTISNLPKFKFKDEDERDGMGNKTNGEGELDDENT